MKLLSPGQSFSTPPSLDGQIPPPVDLIQRFSSSPFPISLPPLFGVEKGQLTAPLHADFVVAPPPFSSYALLSPPTCLRRPVVSFRHQRAGFEAQVEGAGYGDREEGEGGGAAGDRGNC